MRLVHLCVFLFSISSLLCSGHQERHRDLEMKKAESSTQGAHFKKYIYMQNPAANTQMSVTLLPYSFPGNTVSNSPSQGRSLGSGSPTSASGMSSGGARGRNWLLGPGHQAAPCSLDVLLTPAAFTEGLSTYLFSLTARNPKRIFTFI